MKRYVLGFAFSCDLSHVLLMEKKRPAWQAGRWNGVGGKTEGDETPMQAMIREFGEEAGIRLGLASWQHFASLRSAPATVDEWRVEVFATRLDLAMCRTMTDERVLPWPTAEIVRPRYTSDLIGNVPWLVSMAHAVFSGAERCYRFDIVELATDPT